MQGSTPQNKAEALALEVLKLARNTLLVQLRFLDVALSRFHLQAFLEAFPDGSMATDGKTVLFHPRSVLSEYKSEQTVMVRNYLHIVLHCVFSHPFVGPAVDQDCWDLACDIAVEHAINELNLSFLNCTRQRQQSIVIAGLQSQVKYMTAEKIYRYYHDLQLPPEQIRAFRTFFRGDDHTLWYLYEATAVVALGDSQEEGDSGRQSSYGTLSARNDIKADWEEIAQRMQSDLENFSEKHGDTAGSMTQNLKAVTREKYDYADFLWHFSTRAEAMKLDMDEFDQIFYTYGMQLYDRMPLIEPLEYKEVRRVKEFVIAIDTSGSVQGELVQKFVQKTYNILKQQESFHTKINLHIVQCDAEIQESVKITSQEEFDRYLETMQLHGFGGTDFRPVFRYIDRMIAEHEFTNLKGMIYFTDGVGTFPETMPSYLSAFVFVQDDYETPQVPPWAIKLILRSDEI